MNALRIIARGLDIARQHVEFIRHHGGRLAVGSCSWCQIGVELERQTSTS